MQPRGRKHWRANENERRGSHALQTIMKPHLEDVSQSIEEVAIGSAELSGNALRYHIEYDKYRSLTKEINLLKAELFD
jgi:hypothetical protein